MKYDHANLSENMGFSASNYRYVFVDDDSGPLLTDPSENADSFFTEYHGTHVADIRGIPTVNPTDVTGISD